ncbi:hypothetical protein [Aeromonas salmonicida]|uniref:hypothetical protein n=1 Tax=Aeromonas salmonicida TaxID=645 RepID=UPI003F7CCBCD
MKTQAQNQLRNAAKTVYLQFAEQYGVGRFRQRKQGEYRFTVDFIGAFVFNDKGVWIRQGDGKTDHLVSINDGYIDHDFDQFTLFSTIPLTAAILTVLIEHGFTCKPDGVRGETFVDKMISKPTLIDAMRFATDLAAYAGLDSDAVRYMGLDGITIQGNDYRLFLQTNDDELKCNDLTVKMFAYGQVNEITYPDVVNEDRHFLIDSIDYVTEQFVDDSRREHEKAQDRFMKQLLNQIAA